MKRTLNSRNFKSLIVLMVVFWAAVSTISAQTNLVVNGDFEQTSGFDYQTISDYTRIWSGGVQQGQFIHDNTSTNHGIGGLGWPANLTGYSGSGYYLLFNGFGGSQNPTKRAWWQQVNVTTQTTYTFKCYVRNLSQSSWLFNANPSIIQVKINGSAAGNNVTLDVNNYDWVEISRTWNSGNVSGPINIEIFDVYTGNPDNGDDFALDHISFIPNVLYDVTAQDDYVTTALCLNDYVDVNVLQNDNVLPNTNDAQVQVLTNPVPHGTAQVLSDKKIRYTFTDANYNGEVQFNYRVTNHGVVSEATVHINTARPPTVTVNMSNIDPICAGSSFNLPTPTVQSNGSNVTAQGWQILLNGSWQTLNNNNIPYSYNGCSIRYFATNGCDTGYSSVATVTVTDEPTITVNLNNITAICAGYSFNLPTPTVQSNGSTISAQGWQINLNGSWQALNNNNIPYSYNGCTIRYFATNDCGTVYSATVQVTVNDIPIVGSITAPAAICAGESFNLTTPSVTWRHTNQGTGSWEIQINGVWQPLTNSNIPYAYNGCSIRYKAVNGCGEAYSTNNVQVTVYSTEPTYEDLTACDTYIWNGVTCNHTGTYQAQVQNENGCTITAYLNFTMSDAYTETQTYTACESFTWPINGNTYYASCTDTYTIESGNPLICDSIFTLNLTVNNAPEITSNLQTPSDFCAGGLLSVNAPQYQYHHAEGGRTRWDYATSPNGPFHAFDPETYHFEYGSYYLRFVVINDCDSVFSNEVVQFNVNDEPVINGQLSPMQVCVGNPLPLPNVSVDWYNNDTNDRFAEWQMCTTQDGTYSGFNPSTPMQLTQNGYWVHYLARNSCGEVVLGPVRISVISADDVTLDPIVECDFYQLPSGEVITENCVIEYTEEEPCPHTVFQPIEINHSDYTIDPITSCHDDYVWHGMTFHRSDEMQYAWDTLTNSSNCDSIVELQLEFGPYSTYTHNRIACGSYEWEMNPGHIYYETVRDSVFVPATDPDDCDTWYFLELIVGNDQLVEGDPMTECSGFVWHGVAYYDDAIVYDSLLTAVTHCDSIVAHQLSIIQPYHTEMEMTQCQETWWYEHHCDQDGDYVHTFQSVQGCDSIVTLHFSLSETIVHEFDTLACEAFEWYGNSCSVSGQTYSHTFQTLQGCDSLVKMHLTLNVMQMFTQLVSACDSIELNGTIYNQPGEYYVYLDTLYTQNGCDSIIHRVNLTINNSDQIGMIGGSHNVYVASNLISGIYRYDIDTTGIVGDVSWSLTNPDWVVIESQIGYCRIGVTTPGEAILKANFQTSSCGAMERQFEIRAGFFDIEEHGIEVNIYPNPTKGTVHIETEGIESIRLTNMMGQTLDWLECDRSNSTILNLNGFPPSVYMLEIETVNGMVKRRVVVCR